MDFTIAAVVASSGPLRPVMTALFEHKRAPEALSDTNLNGSQTITASRRSPVRIPEFDGLRGVAILLVIIGHFSEFSAKSLHPFSACAGAGVLLFFVLSGFLITSILCNEVEESHRVNLSRFYIRRALRLLPAVWTLIAIVALLKLFGLITDESWVGVGASLCYLRNIFGRGASLGHLWSLSLEEQFYFIWPLLFVFLPRHRLATALSVVLAVAAARAAGIAFALLDVRTGVFYLRPWFRFDSIMAGCVLALFKARTVHLFRSPPVWFRWLTHPAASFGLLAILGHFEWNPSVMPWALTLQTLACVGILAGLAAHSSPWVSRALSLEPLTFLGRISYSLYLWQQLFIVTKSPSWGWVRRPGFDVAIAIGCALLSWYLIERPFLALKSRFHTAPPLAVEASDA
jgi:peptidoglycan/LPS O-acetylase OafA/YrhL